VTCDLSGLVFLSGLALSVLAAHRRAAFGAGARIVLAPDMRTTVCAALNGAQLPGSCETAGGTKACAGQGAVAEDSRALSYPNVNDVQRTFGVTWGQLVERESQLETLLGRARLGGARCRTFADVDRAFGPLRNELAALLGFAGKHHSDPVLGSAGAYEVAYWKLYNAVAESLRGIGPLGCS
jgi:hypothetical protein